LVITGLLALYRRRRRDLDQKHLDQMKHLLPQAGQRANRFFVLLEEIQMLLYRLPLP
jgi:hypothetical protein